MGSLLFMLFWLPKIRRSGGTLGELLDPQVHLCYEDVKVDNKRNPPYLQVSIKASKTDLYRQLYIGATNAELCPVTAVISFMVVRGNSNIYDKFVTAIREALTKAGLNAGEYAGHRGSYQQGLQDSLIKTLGRWQSSAYTLYIRTF